MAKTKFTQSEVDDFLKGKPEVLGIYHNICDQMCYAMKVHADGLYPTKLIDERRPNEPLEVKEYRKIIFKPKTKPTFSKVYSSLQKIRRSQDWSIRYNDNADFPKIADDETLESYCETHFPYFTSITNWVFSLLLRKYLTDPNAVVFVAPLVYDVPENEFLQPFPEVYDSCNVLYFVPEDYAILKVPNGCIYYVRNKPQKGNSFYFVTTEYIYKYDQVDAKGNYALVLSYEHRIGILPVFKLKGILIDQCESQFLYESRIAGMLPELDEALREYSDLQAAKVLHIYPERWEYAQNECQNCKGTGRRQNPTWVDGMATELAQIECSACQGRGYKVAGPYSKIMVRPANSMEIGQVPTPPAGYVEKDVEIVKLQEEGVRMHIYNALAAINFEFLADTPLSQSGVAKEVDKDELNNTVHSIAEDIVAIMDNLYWNIARYRYKDLYPLEEVDGMLPVVNVPEKFDMLSSGIAAKELNDAKTGKMNPVILSAMEIDFAGKRFNTEPEVRDLLHLILTLDPLPNITEDEKMSRLSNKGITQETYVISSNIQEFVQRAVDEKKGFVEMELKAQKEILLTFAEEMIASTDTAGKIIDDMNNNIYGAAV